ncbi:ATP-binding protein [Streptomyces sp. NPDC041068]|uniref:ATP-binding protein n=1 Tax=Streptomyces sp. NPDC041068 TaxID=3155130 RepID=UPI0033F394CF
MKTQISTPQNELKEPGGAPRTFRQLLSPTPRGARLARRLTAHQLETWGIPYGSALSEAATHIVAELAANAVTHGHVPGRDFELRLARRGPNTLRIEVADARGDRRPKRQQVAPDAESGRGLRLVDALADTWGVTDRTVGKTVWAELRDEPRG